LSYDWQRIEDRDGTTRDDLRQVVALDQLHDQGTEAAGFLQSVNMRDVRMIERGQRLGFAREPREAIRIVRERVGQNFQRDIAIELGIAGSPHLPHPAFANRGDDFVDAETGAWG